MNEEKTNVINVRFDRRRSVKPESFLPSDLLDDPLEDLMNEFNDLKINRRSGEKEDFIFHQRQYKDQKITTAHSSIAMSDILMSKIKKIKNDVKRMKYYQDEINPSHH